MNEYWYPWYPEVYAGATMHLTAEQDGIYRRLIDHYMRTRQPLPDNDVALARIASVSENKWLDASSMLRAFFKQKNGMLCHAFCDQLLDKQDKLALRRSDIARKAAAARHKGNQEDACLMHAPSTANAQQMVATGQDKTGKKNEKENTKRKITEANARCFDEWYGEYPHKVGRAAAERAFAKAIAIAEHHELMQGLQNYITTKPKDRPWCNPATWLNQQRWKDQPNEIAQGQFTKHKTRSEQADDILADFLSERGITPEDRNVAARQPAAPELRSVQHVREGRIEPQDDLPGFRGGAGAVPD